MKLNMKKSLTIAKYGIMFILQFKLIHIFRINILRNIKIIFCFILFYTIDSSAQNDSVQMVHLLRDYVCIPSIHGQEGTAGKLISEYAKNKNLYTEVLSDHDSNYNVVISLYPLKDRKPNILFLSHIDVVDPGPVEEWNFPPFNAVITGDTIWGRGTLDNKSNTVMHLFALLNLAATENSPDYKQNVSLLLVSNEESGGGYGAEWVVQHFFEYLNPVLVIGEGPHGINRIFSNAPEKFVHVIANSNKTKIVLELECNTPGKQAHASLSSPHSANNKMIDALYAIKNKKEIIHFNPTTKTMLKELGRTQSGFKGHLLQHPGMYKPLISAGIKFIPDLFPFFSNTHNITLIDNPELESTNIIPSKIRAIVDCRIQPHFSSDKYLKFLLNRVDLQSISVKILYHSPENNYSPLNTAYFETIESCLRQSFPDAKIMPGQLVMGTDCQYFRAKGVPVYSFIPVELPQSVVKSAHASNEHFLLSTLNSGMKVYLKIMNELLKGSKNIATMMNKENNKKNKVSTSLK